MNRKADAIYKEIENKTQAQVESAFWILWIASPLWGLAMTNVALSHNLSVICGHFQELSDSHAALVTVLTFADGHDSIGNFLLSHDE